MRICELKQMEVINQATCKRLGFVADIDFDICTGCITALIVPGCGKIFGIFGIEKEYVIPSSCIVQIGTDVILVNVDEEEVYVNCKY